MKGKLYNPNSVERVSPHLKKTRSEQHYKNFSITSLECIWPSSIPDS